MIALTALLAVPMTGLATLSLEGTWQVTGRDLSGTASLPGTLCDAGLGREMTRADYEATDDVQQRGALMRKRLYLGEATYARDFELTSVEAERPLELVLERVMWRSAVRIDGRALGERDSLGTPHVYPVGRLAAGRHRIEIAVDNSCRYGFSRYSHSYGPVMQSVWHGVLGRIALRPANPLGKVRVFASFPANGRLELRNVKAKVARLEGRDGLAIAGWTQRDETVEVHLAAEPEGWSDLSPRLYALALTGEDGQRASVRFGFRTYCAKEHAILVNGVRTFLRGNVDNCNFAKTGSPAMTKEEWLAIFRTLKREDGVNMIRFHSWCPPGAAFAAADEAGLYLMPEAGIWTDRWMKSRDRAHPEPEAVGHGLSVDAFVRRELRDIVDAYGNSPSFLSLGIGNELGTTNWEVAEKWIEDLRAFDPRRLYFVSTARRITRADDIAVTHHVPDVGMVRERFLPRNDWDYEDVYARAPVPVLAHEIGQWPVYPMWDSLAKFDAGVLRPYDMLPFLEQARTNGMVRFNRELHEASAKASRLVYKEEVESFLRTPSCAGVELLNIQDFTGQGEALVGWRDAFYDLKPAYATMAPFATVWHAGLNPLARMEKFTWTQGETFRARLQVRNLTDRTVRAGRTLPCAVDGRPMPAALAADLAPGAVGEAGAVELALDGLAVGRHVLTFGQNAWSFWVYPEEEAAAVPAGVTVTADCEAALKALEAGGTVLFTGRGRRTAKDTFKPVYWSVVHFENKNPLAATLGTWVDSRHPALAGFPSEDWADWQWRSLVDGAVVHELRGLSSDYRPICLSVSDFHYSLFLSSLFEVAVGPGRLMVCGYDLGRPTPESRRLRASLMAYLAAPRPDGLERQDLAWFGREFRPVADEAPKAASDADAVNPVTVNKMQ